MAVKPSKTPKVKARIDVLSFSGTILAILGVLFLANQLFEDDLVEIVWPYAWPVALVLVGLFLIFRRNHRI